MKKVIIIKVIIAQKNFLVNKTMMKLLCNKSNIKRNENINTK